MYKEIKFNEKDIGKYGLFVTNPSTRSRALVGIFDTRMEAYKLGEHRQIKGTVVAPVVCRWTKKNYDRYNYVFNK